MSGEMTVAAILLAAWAAPSMAAQEIAAADPIGGAAAASSGAAGPGKEGAGPTTRDAKAHPSSCVACHAQLEGTLKGPVDSWGADVHGGAGLGCESCHGGDPAPSLSEDARAAMDPKRGYRPSPDRLHLAELCGGCHSNALFMKRYNPQMRVDQLTEYRSSVHGTLNRKGDPDAATCIDCHGTHGIRSVSSPESPAYATNVPATCARCHSDAKKMARYGIPTNQYEEYRRSIHAGALLERGDTAAPACNDCHGNHGAAPPGVRSVAHVCGQCHGREAGLFEASFKKDLFERMGVGECAVCHDHHGIRHPTPEFFHGPSEPQVSTGTITNLVPFEARVGDLAAGQRVSAAWRVSLRPHLESTDEGLVHPVEVAARSMEPIVLDATLRPGDLPLAAETRHASASALAVSLRVEAVAGFPVQAGDSLLFRLDMEAGTGGAVDVRVRDHPGRALEPLTGSSCRTCHEKGDACDQATERMYSALTDLDRELRRAASLLRKAAVAGMEVSAPAFDLKSKGTSAAIEARALIHAFDEERLRKRVREGEAVAASALAQGERALEELRFRRKGLALFIALALLVLLGLYLKIRQTHRQLA